MGSLRGLALPLLFVCLQAGAPGSSAGPSTSAPDPFLTAKTTQAPAGTAEARTSSEGTWQATHLAETSVPAHATSEARSLSAEIFASTFISAGTISKAETRTKTISSATQPRTPTKTIPSKLMAVITTSLETLATTGVETGLTTVEANTGSGPTDAVLDTFCTDDSSEEARRILVDIVTWAHTSPGAGGLPPGSSSSFDNSVSVITTSQALAPDIMTATKALVPFTITHVEVTTSSLMGTGTAATTSGTSSTTGAEALPTSGTTALSASTTAASYPPDTSSSAETSTACSTEPATSSATGYSAMGHSPSEAVTINSSVSSDSTSNGLFPTHRHSLPSARLTTASSSQETHSTTAETTTSAETTTTAETTTSAETTTTAKTTTSAKTTTPPESTTKIPVAVPFTPTRKTTKVDPGGAGAGGFLLLRLSVASTEDLTDPWVAGRLMRQLHRELHSHMPAIQVSLLRRSVGFQTGTLCPKSDPSSASLPSPLWCKVPPSSA
ncbi:mucin-20 [Lepus europaeus]|uniref:mucin-20 n=1 Tax=Lepus europaeus TaxID=9983 RepID=UPI002B4978A8|nr:mucin-20 [Lepus europaeus]